MKKLLSMVALTVLIISAVFNSVSLQAASDGKIIYATGFDTGTNVTADTIFWMGGSVNTVNSGYTTQTDEVIDGTRSYKYSLNIQNGWNDLGGTDAGKLTMSAGKTYTAAFKFKKTDIAEFTVKIEEMNVWATIYELYFNADTMIRLGGVNSTSGYTLSSLDNYNYVQFSFTAPALNNSFFKFAAKGNGTNPTFIIEDFFVYEGNIVATDIPAAQQSVMNENFESGFSKFTPFIVPTLSFQSCTFITNKENEVINQSGSALGSLNYPEEGTQWCAYMSTKEGVVDLSPASSYTIQFRYKIIVPAQNFFYFIIKNTDYLKDRYIGFNSNGIDLSFAGGITNYKIIQDGDFNILTATFTTLDSAGYNLLQFGSNGGGKISFDDITLYKGVDANLYGPAVFAPLTPSVPIFTETFEEGFSRFDAFISDSISSQAFSKITSDSSKVINGTRSVVGSWNYPAEGTQWSAFIKSKPGAFTLEKNQNYTVKFRYRIVRDAQDFFYVILNHTDPLKSQYLGFNSLGADFSFASGVSNYIIENDGPYKNITIVFSTISDNEGYGSFDFGAKGGGEIILDDIKISKGVDQSAYASATYKAHPLTYTFGNEFNSDIVGSNFWISGSDEFGGQIVTDNRKINGAASYLLFSKNTRPWADILYSDILKQGATFEPNTRYTVTFKYKAAVAILSDNLPTGNFYFALKPNDGNVSYDYHLYQGFSSNGKVLYINGANIIWRNGIEEFDITDSGKGYYNAKITFKTLNRDDYRIVFGMMNGGAMIIDDVKTYEWNVAGSNDDTANPETGDSSETSYMLLLLILSVITSGFILSLNLKANKQNGGSYEI